jgi:hypothetical protein
LGHVAQDRLSPSGVTTSDPPQDPRRQRPDTIRPIAIAAMPTPKAASVIAKITSRDDASKVGS